MLNDLETGEDVERPLLNKERVKKIRSKKSKSKMSSGRRSGSRSEMSATPDKSKEVSYPVITGGAEPGAVNEPEQSNRTLERLRSTTLWVG